MTQTEALQKALDALNEVTGWQWAGPMRVMDEVEDAITAIREVLAQPEQEPVATMWQHGETGRTRITTPDSIRDCDARWFKVSDLYTSPPHRKPLTDQEIALISAECSLRTPSDIYFARAIEAAHGIKGEA